MFQAVMDEFKIADQVRKFLANLKSHPKDRTVINYLFGMGLPLLFEANIVDDLDYKFASMPVDKFVEEVEKILPWRDEGCLH